MENKNQHIDMGEQLRLGMRHWASGVGVAATEFEGKKYGLTVSSFTSISMDPPIVLISVIKTSSAHDPMIRSGKFGVTLLTEEQQRISDRFAGRADRNRDRFADLGVDTLKTGSPLIAGGLAGFDCEIMDTFDTGTTTAIFGRVVAVKTNPLITDEMRPLLYYYQDYRKLSK